MRKTSILAMAMLMAIPWFAACKGASEGTAAAAPKVLNLQWHASIGTDSIFECPWFDQQSLYPDMVFDTMIKVNGDGTVFLPRLAKSWTISGDAKSYTFVLVDNAKWHDGAAFSVADVLFSFNTLFKVPNSTYKRLFSKIDGSQAVIDKAATTLKGLSSSGNTVTFTLSAPDNFFMKALCLLPILPQHLLKDADPTTFTKYEAFWKKPVGTGAYRIDEVSFPSYFTLLRNKDYHGTKPGIEKVLFTSYVTGGNEAVIAAAIAGKVDYAYGNAVNDINNAKNIVAKNPDIKMKVVPATYIRYFRFNNVGSSDNKYDADMQKVDVRQAINLLLDKEAAASFYKGQSVSLSSYIHPQSPFFNASIPPFQRNVAKAKEMLIAAKFDFSKTLRILYYYNDQTTIDIMELVKQNFADAGIKVETFLATGDLASIIYKVKNYDMIYCGASNADAILMYRELVPDNGSVDAVFGDVPFRQELFGKLLDRYTGAADTAEQKRIGDQIQIEANKYCMTAPIYALNKVCIYNAGRLKLDESFFKMDLFGMVDYQFDKWELK